MTEIRILTVRQPWAWAICRAGKNVENRSRNIAGAYRGPVLIHAGQQVDRFAFSHRMFNDVEGATIGWSPLGVILGVVDLVDIHHVGDCAGGESDGSCSPWAEMATDVWHLRLENPRLLTRPVPWKGKLGLTTFDTVCKLCQGGRLDLLDGTRLCRFCGGTGERIPGLRDLL